MNERCEIAACRAKADLSYLGHGICASHWDELTADDAPPDALRMALGIGATLTTATEVDMSDSKKTETKTAKAKKTFKEPKPKKEKAPKEALCVFALRMTEAERTKLHETAGPANASRLARAVLVAAAHEDEAGFKSALAEARKLRA